MLNNSDATCGTKWILKIIFQNIVITQERSKEVNDNDDDCAEGVMTKSIAEKNQNQERS